MTPPLALTALILAIAGLLAALLQLRWSTLRRQLIHGSHPRYVMTTKCIIASAIEAILWGTAGAINVYLGHLLTAALDAVIVCLCIHRIYQLLSDDNWFNRAWKKLKQHVRKLSELRLHLPLPRPSTA